MATFWQQYEKNVLSWHQRFFPVFITGMSAEELVRLGCECAEAGDYEVALTRFDSALALAAYDATVHEQRAQVLPYLGCCKP